MNFIKRVKLTMLYDKVFRPRIVFVHRTPQEYIGKIKEAKTRKKAWKIYDMALLEYDDDNDILPIFDAVMTKNTPY